LTPLNLYKIESFSNDYTFYVKSAMETAVSNSILIPFGGEGIFLKKDLNRLVTFQSCLDRIVIIALRDNLLICVYMPSAKFQFDVDIIIEILAEIENTIKMFPNNNIVWGGDFNINLSLGGAASVIIYKFISDYILAVVTSNVSANVNIVDFTYKHATQASQSFIDYFIIDKCLYDSLIDFDIIDCGSNLFDHCPLILIVADEILNVNSKVASKKLKTAEPTQHTLRWDHANRFEFYNRTFMDSDYTVKMLNNVYI